MPNNDSVPDAPDTDPKDVITYVPMEADRPATSRPVTSGPPPVAPSPVLPPVSELAPQNLAARFNESGSRAGPSVSCPASAPSHYPVSAGPAALSVPLSTVPFPSSGLRSVPYKTPYVPMSLSDPSQPSALARSGRIDLDAPGGRVTLQRFESYEPSELAASGSCAVPGVPYPGSVPGPNRRIPSRSVWLGAEDVSGPPVDVSALVYSWLPNPRKDVHLRDALRLPNLRPDMQRFRRMLEAGREADAAVAWETYLAQGEPYQVPDEIPCDRTFVFSVPEVRYVEQMAAYLFGSLDPLSHVFVLAEIAPLYRYLAPFVRSRERIAARKTAMTVTRLTRRAFAASDWPVFRSPMLDPVRVTRDLRFAPGLSAEYFPPLPDTVLSALPPVGVQVALPFVLMYFGFAAADPNHPYASRLSVFVNREWAVNVTCAYMREVNIESRAFIVSE